MLPVCGGKATLALVEFDPIHRGPAQRRQTSGTMRDRYTYDEACMSPDSQRLEVELASARALRWFAQQPDMNRLVENTLAFWLKPALAELDIDENALAIDLADLPEAEPVRVLLMEEAFGSHDDDRPYARFMRGPGEHEGGLRRRYLRRLAASSPRFLQVSGTSPGKCFEVAPIGGGTGWTIHDREGSRHVLVGDALIARLIDMPAGKMLGTGLIRVHGLVGSGIPDNELAVSQVLSDVIVDLLRRRHERPASARRGSPDDVVPAREQSDPTRSGDPTRVGGGTAGSFPPREDAPLGRDRDKLIDRVRKLFAMAQEGEASPHEAEIALRRCQSLMTKYGITEADLETSAFATVGFGYRRTVPTHLRILASAVAEMHDVLFVTGEQGHTEFRGFEVDAHVARLTLDYLLDAVERALKARKRTGDFPPGRSAAYDYRLGFSTEVERRVETLVNERKAQQRAAAGGGGTDLTVRKLEIVERECGQDLVTRSFGSRAPQDATAHGAGRVDGATVSLDRQVGGTTARPSLPRS